MTEPRGSGPKGHRAKLKNVHHELLVAWIWLDTHYKMITQALYRYVVCGNRKIVPNIHCIEPLAKGLGLAWGSIPKEQHKSLPSGDWLATEVVQKERTTGCISGLQ